MLSFKEIKQSKTKTFLDKKIINILEKSNFDSQTGRKTIHRGHQRKFSLILNNNQEDTSSQAIKEPEKYHHSPPIN